MFKRSIPVLLALFALGLFSAAAQANAGWEVTSRAYPTNLPPGGTGQIEIDLFNVGNGPSEGTVTVTDTLPTGVEATEMGAVEADGGPASFKESESELERVERQEEQKLEEQREGSSGGPDNIGSLGRVVSCSGVTVVTCTTRPGYGGVLRPIGPGYFERIGIKVRIAAGASGVVANRVTAAGGGALGSAEVYNPIAISSTAAGFGFAGWDGWFTNADGTPDTQAGSHPYEATFTYDFNTEGEKKEGRAVPAGGDVRDLAVELPPGLVGDPNAVPLCTHQQFEDADFGFGCPAETQVGVDWPGLGSNNGAPEMASFPVYNLVPPAGVPAQFAFYFDGEPIFLDAGVRDGSDYGITEHIYNIAARDLVYNTITIWGEPAEESHNRQRCSKINGTNECNLPPGVPVKPFLTLPTSCEGPSTARIHADTWENSSTGEASYVSRNERHVPVGLTGCEHLGFAPLLSAAPDTSAADTPAGLTVDVKVPQEGLVDSEGLAMSNIKNTTVTLPKGVAVNPGQATGLENCGPAEDGLTTEAETAAGGEDAGPPSCPNASKVGTVQIATPLFVKSDLEGDVYLLQSTPPNLKLLIAASGEGVNLKIVADVHLDETTGQLTTTLTNTPELPFTDFKLSFSGGAQAALTTPTQCGAFETTSDFTPWSSPEVSDAFLTSSFGIDSGSGGAACAPSPLPFSPTLIAGSTTDQAGGYTAFSLLLTRPDDQQRVSSLQFHVPEGLLGMISKVPLCGEPQASKGECSEASQIGHTVVESGPGPYPLVVPQPGRPPAPIYLTGPYKGAPYGLAIVVPLEVGPFTLPTQVVRAKIEVNPLTTELTVTTDELPQTISGVPADLRTINAVIDKPGFMFNPTGCEPESFSGTATGVEGASAPISSHFQMGSCRALLFQPNFKVSTSAKTSRADGATLNVHIVYPTGELGANQASSQSNIEKVKVELPERLPSRLTTLQKACTAAQFNSNPAGCPAASVVGHATALTPVLPVALTGPAYFVSNGGEAFPNLIVVLQGYGVTVDLVGDTFISKAGITSSTFKSVPDVPIGSFELNLPQGPFSALTGLGNLCKGSLVMPTEFVGHNGAEIHQNTRIAVTGCPTKAKKTGHKKKQGKGAKGKRRKKG